jgi:fumarate hydratase class II
MAATPEVAAAAAAAAAAGMRRETDTQGVVFVDSRRLYGAQTERSRLNFPIGGAAARMPLELIHAYGVLKIACARINARSGKLAADKADAIIAAAREVMEGRLDDEFPLVIFQTGSGTQTNVSAPTTVPQRTACERACAAGIHLTCGTTGGR